MNIVTVNIRSLIAATMVAVATLPSIGSAGPSDSLNTIEGIVVTGGSVDRVVSTGGASGSGSVGPAGLGGKGSGQFGNKETITNVDGIYQGTKGKISGTMVLGSEVGSVTNTGTAVNVGGIMQK